MTSPTLDSVLLPYQQRWVADQSGVKVAEKSRRVGITWAEAADDTLFSASAKGDDVNYIGHTKDLAVEFIETCGMWARAFSLAVSEMEDAGEVLEEADKEKGIQAFKVRFASGHKIVALSSRPRNLRGRKGRVVLDEFAFHDDPAELVKAAMALRIWGGTVRIISTHNGEENAFNELVTDIRAKRKPFSIHRVTFDEAIADGLYRRRCEKLGEPWSAENEKTWRDGIVAEHGTAADEELFCIPRSGGGAYIPGTMIQARMLPLPVKRWEQKTEFSEAPTSVREIECQAWLDAEIAPLLELLNPKLPSVFGEDFGRSGDLTVIWPAQIRGDLVRATSFVVELRNIPFEQQRQVLFFIVDRLPRFRAGKLDSRGNGQYLAEVAMQRYGAGRIEQVMLTAEWYRANMPPYKAAFEDGTVILPRDTQILDDHRALRIVNGIPRIPERSTNDKGAQQRHGDSAIAGCMMFAASNADPIEYDYAAAPKSTHRTDDAPENDDGYVFGGGVPESASVSRGGGGF